MLNAPYTVNKQQILNKVNSLSIWQTLDSKLPQIPQSQLYTFRPKTDHVIFYRRLLFCLYNQCQQQWVYNLTSYILCININNYYGLMLRNCCRQKLWYGNTQDKQICQNKHNKNQNIGSTFSDPNEDTNTNKNRNKNNKEHLHQQKYGQLIKEQLHFINCLLFQNPKQYQLWNYKKDIFTQIKKNARNFQNFQDKSQRKQQNQQKSDQITFKISIDIQQIIKNEQQFMFYLMVNDDQKNYHIWDYKMWLTLNFNRVQLAIKQTYQKLFSKPQIPNIGQNYDQTSNVQVNSLWENCYSCWSYRYNLIMNLSSTQKIEQFINKDLSQVFSYVLQKNPLNQSGWNYLGGLLQNQYVYKQQKFKIFKILQNICQSVKDKQNRYAWQLLLRVSEDIQVRKLAIEALKKIDKVRISYYQYLEDIGFTNSEKV